MNTALTDPKIINRNKGRLILVNLILLFALPAIIAKVILVQNWYQSGVTNKGELIEPRLTYTDLGISVPYAIEQSWHLGFVIPANCNEFCERQLHILKQSYVALGKYQPRVSPVIYVTEYSDSSVNTSEFDTIVVNAKFSDLIASSEYLVTDPLGQLVMKYPKVIDEQTLQAQSKDLLFDLRKLLKLSRVG